MYGVGTLERVVRKEPADRIIEIRRHFDDHERPPIALEFLDGCFYDRSSFRLLALLASDRRKGLSEGEPRYGPRSHCRPECQYPIAVRLLHVSLY